jgi:hypothetical protein
MVEADDERTGDRLARHAAARGDGTLHPSEDDWERLACGELSRDEVARLLEHVRDCSACLRVQRALLLLESEAAAFDPGVPQARPLARAVEARAGHPLAAGRSTVALRVTALAASLLAAALLYPAFLGLTREPAARTASVRAPSAGGLASGVLRLEVLRGSDDADAPRLVLPAGQRQVVLLVDPPLGLTIADGARLRFELRSAGGALAWEAETTAGEVRRGLASPAEAVALVVPAELLGAGLHSLRLRDASGAPLLETAFDVLPANAPSQAPLDRNAPQ